MIVTRQNESYQSWEKYIQDFGKGHWPINPQPLPKLAII
ncbi:predicted protein [Sclerotinia sclerotiorum 1980 UF-70]|uniref:Uncharacterized protein n=1 Tax=Sclerotinia sclerotiorum (strain ATCC 18683 / 1980 / Ss-1) TaxID=665079 RepID=A7F0U6_SCLS1|nr:predicted protein [Sclerotinia sclerotiorum 1980 UF-70]EDN95338.1 predicted protein [Sclerotinia sclerotiorum 1980 UF-70]